MSLRVLVAEDLASAGVEAIASHYEAVVGTGWSRDELLSRIGDFDALATLIAIGPRTAPLRAQLAAATGDVLVAPSPIADDAALVRVAAPGAESLVRALRALLAPTVILLGDDPFARKGSLAWDDAMR